MCEANDCYSCVWLDVLSDVQDCENLSGSTPTVECNAPCMVRMKRGKDESW